MSSTGKYRFLFAGGGTGGHLYPAVAVAEKIRERLPQSRIMFIGTRNRIEGTVVPKLGFDFRSIWIRGFSRTSFFQNVLFPLKLLVSTVQSFFINLIFQPRVAIGSGGYVAGPAIYSARLTGARIILIEPNSYPGVTTRLLEKYADETHIAFEESEKYLRNKRKIYNTGNPVRNSLQLTGKESAIGVFGLRPDKKTILVLGGSLGAASINNAISQSLDFIRQNDLQLIWQTGRNYFKDHKEFTDSNVKILPFIDEMNLAYSSCDLMICRAGATTIAEITVLGIPAVLIPSPNVAENHQYYNAKHLSDRGAAVLVEDKDCREKLPTVIAELISNNDKLQKLRENARRLGRPEAAGVIADRAIQIVEKL